MSIQGQPWTSMHSHQAENFWNDNVGKYVYTPDNKVWEVLNVHNNQVSIQDPDGTTVTHHVNSHFLSFVEPVETGKQEIERLNGVIARNKQKFIELQEAARKLMRERDVYKSKFLAAEAKANHNPLAQLFGGRS